MNHEVRDLIPGGVASTTNRRRGAYLNDVAEDADRDDAGSDEEASNDIVGIRAAVALAVGLLCGLLAARYLRTDAWADILVGWIAGGLVFVGWTWIVIFPMNWKRTRSHATREDATHFATVLFVVTASVLSLGAVGCLLRTGSKSGLDALQEAGISVAGIAIAWVAVHSVFAVHYAHLYYSGSEGGIGFNQKQEPRYTDFGYVAFTIGMAYAVSDTAIDDGGIRRVVLWHALVSYLFGAVILAATVNLIVGLPK